MRYLANIALTLTGADGVPYAAAPGDPVPGFATWPYPVQLAHRRLEWVRAEPLEDLAPPPHDAAAGGLPPMPTPAPRPRLGRPRKVPL